ncbi:DNA double-strand break repair nuclease NurA [uncultured Methanobrevibacter sp.]|uniref:DNA double-strand break repair nuclease NurA n=1 Tax=uncultured Methanobrevibacter sp. TaxID=253161 RepID=UPI0025832014|nr:DNA double-strand break repair nuclease NurA [uncultured Methanobrevibacter sp.]
MLESLYLEAIKKKDSIQKEIEDFEQSDFDIDKFWNFTDIQESNDNFKIAAGDGSYSSRKFLAFNLYAVGAVSYIYNRNNGLDSIEKVDFNIAEHQKNFTDKLRNKMNLFEIDNAVKCFNDYDIDYYMIDGSVYGDLFRIFPYEEKLKDIYTSKLECMYNLLKFDKGLMAISKTSTTNEYFHSNIPDMSIFQRFNKLKGYSNPIYKKVKDEFTYDFPIMDNYFKSLEFTVFYLRLEDYKNVLKVELPYRANKKEIEKVVSIIKRESIEGYPYLLKKAHNEVVIHNKNVLELAEIVGLYEKSGREMLN